MEGSNLPTNLCLFEDGRYPNFFPLSLNRPLFDLHIGTQTLGTRIIDEVNPERLSLLCRPYLAPVLIEREKNTDAENPAQINEIPDEEILFLNGRLLTFGDELKDLLSELVDEGILHKSGVAVAARLSGDKAASFLDYLSGPVSDENVVRVLQDIKKCSSRTTDQGGNSPEKVEGKPGDRALEQWAEENKVKLNDTGIRLLSHYWQLIGENGRCILDDFQKNPLRGTAPEAELFKGVDLINEEDIVIGSEVEVRSGTVLDASEGPIIIADGVLIEPSAIIFGPCYIGDNSIIRGGARIGHETSVGKQCRIGGEVGETIFASYSNKQHGGFIGHSYIGSWVNIGAGTNNSDLKNNYKHVKAWCAGKIKDTGRRFLGVIIGDHSKTAINTSFNTGTVVGFNANIVAVGFTPKLIPSFTWLIEPEFEKYDLEKAIETAGIMMDRRDVPFTPALKEQFKVIYRLCKQSGHTV